MKLREHLTYANVAATLALAGVIGGGGAYAASQIGSGDIRNNSIRSKDLKNRKAVRGKDVKRNGLTGKEIRERTLDAADFAPLAANQGSCDPIDVTFVDCVTTSVRLKARGRLLVIATGDFVSEGGPARLECRIALEGSSQGVGVAPGEATSDNTALGASDGFATTLVTNRIAKGLHDVALRCSQPLAADGRLDSASIAVLGVSG